MDFIVWLSPLLRLYAQADDERRKKFYATPVTAAPRRPPQANRAHDLCALPSASLLRAAPARHNSRKT